MSETLPDEKFNHLRWRLIRFTSFNDQGVAGWTYPDDDSPVITLCTNTLLEPVSFRQMYAEIGALGSTFGILERLRSCASVVMLHEMIMSRL